MAFKIEKLLETNYGSAQDGLLHALRKHKTPAKCARFLYCNRTIVYRLIAKHQIAQVVHYGLGEEPNTYKVDYTWHLKSQIKVIEAGQPHPTLTVLNDKQNLQQARKSLGHSQHAFYLQLAQDKIKQIKIYKQRSTGNKEAYITRQWVRESQLAILDNLASLEGETAHKKVTWLDRIQNLLKKRS